MGVYVMYLRSEYIVFVLAPYSIVYSTSFWRKGISNLYLYGEYKVGHENIFF